MGSTRGFATAPSCGRVSASRQAGGQEEKLLTARPGVIRSRQHCCGSGGGDAAPADPTAGMAETAATVAYSPGLVNHSQRNLLQYATPQRPDV
jgi:hypothetical protein